MKWEEIVIILGFVFAGMAFISPFLLKVYVDLWMTSTPTADFIAQARANPFPPFTLIVNPITMGIIGMIMGGILKTRNDELVKKWGNKVVIANLVAVPVGFAVWFLTMIISL